jgi:hypothetical protein
MVAEFGLEPIEDEAMVPVPGSPVPPRHKEARDPIVGIRQCKKGVGLAPRRRVRLASGERGVYGWLHRRAHITVNTDHWCTCEPLVAIQQVRLPRPDRIGCDRGCHRRVGSHVGPTLPLSHRHPKCDPILVSNRNVAVIVNLQPTCMRHDEDISQG